MFKVFYSLICILLYLSSTNSLAVSNKYFSVSEAGFDCSYSNNAYIFLQTKSSEGNFQFNINIIVTEKEDDDNISFTYSEKEIVEIEQSYTLEFESIINNAIIEIKTIYPEVIDYYTDNELKELFINYQFYNTTIGKFNNYKCFIIHSSIYNNDLTQYIFDSDNYIYTITVSGNTSNNPEYDNFVNTFKINDSQTPKWLSKIINTFLSPKVISIAIIGGILAIIQATTKKENRYENSDSSNQ